MEKQLIQLKVPRDNEVGPEAAKTLFSSLLALPSHGWFKTLLTGKKAASLAFEIYVKDQTIYFQAAAYKPLIPYLQSQVLAQYPNITLQILKPQLDIPASSHLGQLKLKFPYYYPLNTYAEFKDSDPLAATLSILSKAKPDQTYLVQLLVKPTSNKWQQSAQAFLDKGIPQPDGHVKARPDQSIINQKISQSGLAINLRLVAPSQTTLTQLGNSFASFSKGDGNQLTLSPVSNLAKKSFLSKISNRQFSSRPYQVLNVDELATLWHMPTQHVKLPNIA